MTPALARYIGTGRRACRAHCVALWPLRETVSLLNIGLTYLIVAIGATTFAGQGAGILASVLGFVLFDFFLVPPYLTFAISQPKDIFALFVFLGVSTLISWLLAGTREQARQAQQPRGGRISPVRIEPGHHRRAGTGQGAATDSGQGR